MGIGALKKAVFLDRDGVINPPCGLDSLGHPESPLRIEDFKIFPCVGETVKRFNDLGYLVFVVTNQPAAAKGKTTIDILAGMHTKLRFNVVEAGGNISMVYTCLHHPDEKQVVNKTLLGNCDCRKPKPGMLFQAAKDFKVNLSHSWMIGDSWKDIEAGKNAGCKTILILSDLDLSEQLNNCQPDYIANDLSETVEIIRKEE